MINLVASLISTWLLLLLLGVSSGEIRRNGELDVALQEYAMEALFVARPKIKTGVAYEGAVPCNLSGIRVSGMRLKSGSLMTRGVKRYHEFEIPKGVVTHPYVERLALLYHNLANWSIAYYPPPLLLHHLQGQGQAQGYTYLAPILGLLAYDASHLEFEATNTTHLYIHASADPISIHFSHLLLPLPTTSTSTPPKLKCVSFHINGSVTLTNMSSDNICTTFVQGHFSVVLESPPPPTSTSIPGTSTRNTSMQRKKKKKKKIVGGVFGGFALMVMLGIGVFGASKYKHRKKMHSMEMVAEFSEALYITAVGTTKAPAAVGTRTLPKLETEYLP